LEHANRECIIRQPNIFNDQVGDQPTCFLAQAILTSSFNAATTISQKFPEAWQHRVSLQSRSNRKFHGSHIAIARLFPDEYLDGDYNPFEKVVRSIYKAVTEFVTREYYTITNPTLPEYILLVGSYKHCAFLLRHLQPLGSTSKGYYLTSNKSKSSDLKVERGVGPWWIHCRLSPKEYYCLLLGNLVRDREDRQSLWDVIRAQVSDGHAKSMTHLWLAIRHGNNKALVELLNLGWQVNGPFWAYFMTPYRLSTRMERKARYELRYHSPIDLSPRWGDLDTHKGVFNMYVKQQKELNENFEEVTKQNSETLRDRGGRLPRVVLWFRNDRIFLRLIVLYAFIYALFLPFLIAYATGTYWKWIKPKEQKLAWMYIWSLLAVVNPPVVSFRRQLSFFMGRQIFVYVLLIIQLVLQHVVPLFLVVTTNIGNAAWFLPFIVVVAEVFVFISGLAIFAVGCVFAGGIDVCCVMISYLCGKGFRRGPFGIL
jgi:hypothetical protein